MFGGDGQKVKIGAELYRRVCLAAQKSSCSADEFVSMILEREVDKLLASENSQNLSQQQVADIENSLKGLGYLE